MKLVFDLESDGLLDDLTTIHSLVIRDFDTGEVWTCTDYGDPAVYHSIRKGLALLAEASVLYGHNIISFDLPAIRKLHPKWNTKAEIVDTYVAASMLWAHISERDHGAFKRGTFPGKYIGQHSLAAWGHRLGVLKGDYGKQEDQTWDAWSPQMQAYCEQDTLVTLELARRIEQHREPFAESLKIEHDLARYLTQQERNGFPFNEPACASLYADLTARRDTLRKELAAAFPPWEVSLGLWTPRVNNKAIGYVKGVPIERFKTITFNPASRHHIADRLKDRYGWQPTEFTETGEPKLDEDTLKALPYPEAGLLAEHFLIEKRIGQAAEGKQAWLKLATRKGFEGGRLTGLPHIHGRVKQNGAVTHRATHSNPNTAQVPRVGSPFGKESRDLFTVPPGWLLVGADASGLELRCLAHFMAKYDGGAYAEAVVKGRQEDGTDVHSKNRDALGLDGKEGRNVAKGFQYALLYGAGDEKLGSIIEPLSPPARQKKVGAEFRKKFMAGLPAFRFLVEAVQAKAKAKGYLILPDGRRAYVRHQHAALNTLLQGTGAVICKAWIVDFADKLTATYGPQGWTGKWAACAWVHDEVQIAAREGIAEFVAQQCVDSMKAMTERFAFRCPLTGEAVVGRTWAETH